jgi:uncharacterized protein YdhG (YjbR/CyaY superfamily)
MKTNFKTIDEYIQIYPEEAKKILKKIRQTIRETAPDALEAISYQMPTYKLK